MAIKEKELKKLKLTTEQIAAKNKRKEIAEFWSDSCWSTEIQFKDD